MKAIVSRIAPPRFLLFFAMLAAAIAAATLIAPWWRSVMIGFDLSAGAFVVGCIELYNDPPTEMREAAKENDANRSILLFLVAGSGASDPRRGRQRDG